MNSNNFYVETVTAGDVTALRIVLFLSKVNTTDIGKDICLKLWSFLPLFLLHHPLRQRGVCVERNKVFVLTDERTSQRLEEQHG